MYRPGFSRFTFVARVVITLCAALRLGGAQGITPQQNGLTTDLAGPRVDAAWAFGAYYSLCSTARVNCQKSALPVYSTGAGLALGWVTRTERTVSALNYSGEFVASPTASSLNSFGQSARFDVSRKLKPRWSFDLDIAAQTSSLQARLFAPSRALLLVETAGTANSLAQSLLSGATGTSTAALEERIRSSSFGPDQTILVGADERRLLSGVARFHYSQTERLKWNFSASGTYLDYPRFETQAGPTARSNKVRDGAVTFGAVYSLSPRSQVSVEGFSGITSSIFQNYMVERGEVGYHRMLTNNWFTQLHGGAGSMRPIDKFAGRRSWNPDYVGGGDLGYKGRDHSVVLSASRTVADAYGLGFATELTSMMMWSYGKPISPWGFALSGGYQHLEGPGQRPLNAWVGQAGVSRRTGRHLLWVIEGVYASNVTLNPGSAAAGAVSRQFDTAARAGFRVTVRWAPEPKPQAPPSQTKRSVGGQPAAR